MFQNNSDAREKICLLRNSVELELANCKKTMSFWWLNQNLKNNFFRAIVYLYGMDIKSLI
jgi:hypothetical protein